MIVIDQRAPQHADLTEPGRDGSVRLFTPDNQTIDLSAFYQGRACFLIASGPSLKTMDLAALRGPGVVTMGMNNSWSVLRPRLWVAVDPCEKFHPFGWMDPAITKLVPLGLANQRIRFRDAAGQWAYSQWRVRDMPAVFFWQRGSIFEPADFFAENVITWGCDDKVTDSCGVKGIRSVFLAAVKLAYSLGFRTLYLCGTDFHMQRGKPGYAFAQDRTKSAVVHNNRLFTAVSKRMEALLPYMEQTGFRIVNCTPGSRLTVFPFMPLADAIREATADCAGEMETLGYYDETPKPKDEYAVYHEGGGD